MAVRVRHDRSQKGALRRGRCASLLEGQRGEKLLTRGERAAVRQTATDALAAASGPRPTPVQWPGAPPARGRSHGAVTPREARHGSPSRWNPRGLPSPGPGRLRRRRRGSRGHGLGCRRPRGHLPLRSRDRQGRRARRPAGPRGLHRHHGPAADLHHRSAEAREPPAAHPVTGSASPGSGGARIARGRGGSTPRARRPTTSARSTSSCARAWARSHGRGVSSSPSPVPRVEGDDAQAD